MLTRVRRPSLRALTLLGLGVLVNVAACALVIAAAGGLVGWFAGRADPDVVLVPGCPALQRDRSGSAASGDYLDMVVWQGREYVALGTGPAVPRKALGKPVTTVGCSLNELGAGTGWRVAPGPWPNRCASGLASGVPLHALVSVPADCRLAAVVDGEVRVYVAMDLDEPDLTPLC